MRARRPLPGSVCTAWRVSSPSAETLSKTARTSTMAECVLDANVLVAWIDAAGLHFGSGAIP
jgi:hypothetical protein